VAGAAAVTAAATPAAAARPKLSYPNSEPLRIGLVGCGGRGTGAAANALRADENVTLVALGDTFADQVEASFESLSGAEDLAARVAVDEDHKFSGFEAYRKVIDSCDVVLLATPPHFRPEHLEYGVEKGVHLFVEKPVAVDAPGVRRVLASVEKAQQKGLSLVSGLCYRYHFAKRETMKRIHDGAVGDVRAIQTTYNAGGLWHRGREPEWSDMEWQIRNWLYFTWLSGDHIVEQHIHSLDKMSWIMGDVPPARCTASGGRIARTDAQWGNIYDHFNSVFEWENGVKAFSSCRQQSGASSDVSDHVIGTRGTANVQRHTVDAGAWSWRHQSDEPDDMYQNEHDALFASIRKGEPIVDNGAYMAQSTLLAIMARMSAYTGQSITWEQALESELDLSPPAYDWSSLEVRPVARPGITKFS
jgi:predicted dehydrogenase